MTDGYSQKMTAIKLKESLETIIDSDPDRAWDKIWVDIGNKFYQITNMTGSAGAITLFIQEQELLLE